MGFFNNPLLKIARAVVEEIVGRIFQQQSTVSDMIKQPMRAIVQQIIGGVWIGRGADALVEAIEREAMPVVDNVIESTVGIGNAIRTAVDILDQADSNSRSEVETIISIINEI